MEKTKRYIGDGVYADFDGFNIVLTTEDGISTTNKVYLEPSVCKALLDFINSIFSNEDKD